MPFVVSEGDFVNVGSQLVLADVDSNNSVVYVDRVYIEVLNGTPAERLYFNDSLVLQANYTVRIAPFNFSDCHCTARNLNFSTYSHWQKLSTLLQRCMSLNFTKF